MGDRTALTAVIHDCPPVERVRVLEILAQWFDGSDYGEGAGETLELENTYMDPEASCGSADELAGQLEDVPGISFTVWEDPAYEWLGSVRAYTPDLGSYAAECTADGTPVLEYGQIAAVIAAVPEGGDIAAAVALAYGQPWLAPKPE